MEIILNRESNIILAEGRSPSFFKSWRFYCMLVLLIAFAFTFFAWFTLSRPLPLPRGTFFIGVISPHAAKQLLPPNVLNAMPDVWKRTLSSDSSWPIAYGLSNDEDHVRAFLIGPRWMIPQGTGRKTAGLAAYLPDNGLVEDEHTLSYTEAMSWRGWKKQPALRWIQGADSIFRWDGQRLVSDNAWNLPSVPPASNADLSLALGSESRNEAAAPQIALAAGLADLPKLRTLPDTSRYEIWLDGQETQFEKRRLVFTQPLDENQAAVVLGAFSVTQRRALVLPDGSTSIERIQPQASTGTTLFGDHRNDRGETLHITPSELQINATGTNWEIQPAPICSLTSTWTRLSGRAVGMMLDDLGWNLNDVPLTGLQIGTYKGKLAACFE